MFSSSKPFTSATAPRTTSGGMHTYRFSPSITVHAPLQNTPPSNNGSASAQSSIFPSSGGRAVATNSRISRCRHWRSAFSAESGTRFSALSSVPSRSKNMARIIKSLPSVRNYSEFTFPPKPAEG